MIRFRPLLTPTLWFVPAFALLIGLGVWQVQRLAWKTDLIATVEAHMRAPPEPIETVLPKGEGDAEWRHVRLSGRFLNDKEVYLFAPGPEGEPGVQVITPFQTASGIYLVNRGFVPEARRDPPARPEGQIAGETAVSGVLRFSVKPGMFTPAPEAGRRLWFVKDAPAMAQAAGVVLAAPVFVEADATPNPGGFPIGGQTRIDFPNNHLQYAGTWFLLALVLLCVYFAYHRSKGRLAFG